MWKPWATWCWVAVLLLALSLEAAWGRRGGGRGGGSSGGGSKGGGSSRGSFHSLPKSTGRQSPPSSGSSSRGAKLAGAAAVGAAVGYGLSSLGRSHHSRWGHAASPNKQGTPSGFQNPNWSDPMMGGQVYSRACKEPSRVTFLAFTPVVCSVACGLIRS